MSLEVALQMDPIEAVDIEGDSTFALGLEAERRGHSLRIYGPQDLALQGSQVLARTEPLTLRHEKGNHFQRARENSLTLARLMWC